MNYYMNISEHAFARLWRYVKVRQPYIFFCYNFCSIFPYPRIKLNIMYILHQIVKNPLWGLLYQ
jgi:hypothetical protein